MLDIPTEMLDIPTEMHDPAIADRFLALACLAQYLQTLRARRRPWASY